MCICVYTCVCSRYIFWKTASLPLCGLKRCPCWAYRLEKRTPFEYTNWKKLSPLSILIRKESLLLVPKSSQHISVKKWHPGLWADAVWSQGCQAPKYAYHTTLNGSRPGKKTHCSVKTQCTHLDIFTRFNYRSSLFGLIPACIFQRSKKLSDLPKQSPNHLNFML